MRCVLAALAVALAVFTASWPAVRCDKHWLMKRIPDTAERVDRLARAMERSHSLVRRSVCGGLLSGSGTLTSPGYPYNYANNLECVWTITAPAGEHVQLMIDEMNVENQSICAWDKLYVRVADEMVASVLCGSGSVSGSFISGGNQMTIIFMSDGSVTEKGFSATYSSVTLQ